MPVDRRDEANTAMFSIKHRERGRCFRGSGSMRLQLPCTFGYDKGIGHNACCELTAACAYFRFTHKRCLMNDRSEECCGFRSSASEIRLRAHREHGRTNCAATCILSKDALLFLICALPDVRPLWAIMAGAAGCHPCRHRLHVFRGVWAEATEGPLLSVQHRGPRLWLEALREALCSA